MRSAGRESEQLTSAQIEEIKTVLGLIIQTANTFKKSAIDDIEGRCERIGHLLPEPAPTSDARKAFEQWANRYKEFQNRSHITCLRLLRRRPCRSARGRFAW